MLHLVQHLKSGFYEVVSIAKNGEMLSITNQGFETKAMCYKNIRAQMKVFSQDNRVLFQDDSVTPAVVYFIYPVGKKEKLSVKPHPKYIFNK